MFSSKNLILGVVGLAVLVLPACSDDSSDGRKSPSPAPAKEDKKEKDKKTTADTATESQKKLTEAEKRAADAEKRLAEAEQKLKDATQEGVGKDALDALTKERDEAKKAADEAKEELTRLQVLERQSVSQFQGDWVSEKVIYGTECQTLVRVVGKSFFKVLSCSTEEGVGLYTQYESGALANIRVSEAGEVSVDFDVKKTSCQWNEKGVVEPVLYASESGSLKNATTEEGSVVSFEHPVTKDPSALLANDDACKDAEGLRAKVCSFIADEKTITPNHKLGCFVKDGDVSFRETKALTNAL